MSHIYEALEQAERDRKNCPEPELLEPTEPDHHSGQTPSAVSQPRYSIKDVKEYAWHPQTAFLPTLADHNPAIEQFRTLRSQLYHFRGQDGMKVIVVSSAVPAEGKTFVATNLALSLARKSGDGVLLIDGDLRNPCIHTVLGTTQEPGLRQCLSHNIGLFDTLQRVQSSAEDSEDFHGPLSHLVFMPGGHASAGALESGGNRGMENVIEAAREHFAWVIIDTSPVLLAIDAVDIARAADGVLLVARAGVTPFECAKKAKAAFATSRVLGVVLNAVKQVENGPYYYYGQKSN